MALGSIYLCYYSAFTVSPMVAPENVATGNTIGGVHKVSIGSLTVACTRSWCSDGQRTDSLQSQPPGCALDEDRASSTSLDDSYAHLRALPLHRWPGGAGAGPGPAAIRPALRRLLTSTS